MGRMGKRETEENLDKVLLARLDRLVPLVHKVPWAPQVLPDHQEYVKGLEKLLLVQMVDWVDQDQRERKVIWAHKDQLDQQELMGSQVSQENQACPDLKVYKDREEKWDSLD